MVDYKLMIMVKGYWFSLKVKFAEVADLPPQVYRTCLRGIRCCFYSVRALSVIKTALGAFRNISMGAFTKIKSSTGGIAFSFSKRIEKRKSYSYLKGSKWGPNFCNIALRVALLLFLF